MNLEAKTCTCPFLRVHRLPCEHVILVTDHLGLRGTVAGHKEFRRKWVAPYFWLERYVEAYAGVSVQVPPLDESLTLHVRNDARVITRPFLAKPKKGANKLARLTKGRAGKRSRARGNEEAYAARERFYARRTGTLCV